MSEDRQSRTVLGRVELPRLRGREEELWRVVMDLSRRLDHGEWVLVGGLMVVLHALASGRQPPRTTSDVDVLADVVGSARALRSCVAAIEELGFSAEQASSGKVYRFARADGLKIDLLAPDHLPPQRSLRTRLRGETIRIDGGRQALGRVAVVRVAMTGHRETDVPVPDHLGAIVLKAAAWKADGRDRERHAADAAFLVSLVDDPRALVSRLAGSDRKRLRALDAVLGNPTAPEWRLLGDAAADGYISWRLIVGD